MLPHAQLPEPLPELRLESSIQGEQLQIGSQLLRGTWRWEGRRDQPPQRLWLPLDLLESQLGFRRFEGQFEWFGQRQPLDQLPQRTLDDEVSLEVAAWLAAVGVNTRLNGGQLQLSLPAAQLQGLRRGKGETADRLVLDLDAPVFLQRLGEDLLLNLRSDPAQLHQLRSLGLRPRKKMEGLVLQGQASRLRSLSLGDPFRLVLDGISRTALRASPPRQTLHSPAIAPWLRRGLVLERRLLTVGVKPLELLRTGGDLTAVGLRLQPLTMRGGQQGLRFLPQLAQPAGAVVAVNGGFFNRIVQLPLGALRRDGRWLSGPILNRGVIAWDRSDELRFGRLRLDQSLRVNGGPRRRIDSINSGYVQRGLSRYTSDWGPVYRPLSGEEEGLLIRAGVVQLRLDQRAMQQGVAIPPQGELVVARGGTSLPGVVGDRVDFLQWSRSDLARQPNVLGGGPLLMQDGQIVLNGRAEGFSPGFLSLAAPRTLVGQGRGGTWLLTLRGAAGSDPTLLESALAAQQLGLRDVLNLDGGSSTTVVAGGRTVMTGRGGTPRVHNGLGLVPL